MIDLSFFQSYRRRDGLDKFDLQAYPLKAA
jgi:hypothetical protein